MNDTNRSASMILPPSIRPDRLTPLPPDSSGGYCMLQSYRFSAIDE